MRTTMLSLDDGTEVEITVDRKDSGCVTVGHQLITNGERALTKTCTVTCYGSGQPVSYSWTCSDGKNCSGDCSDPAHPKGSCY